jgi:arylsulfatase A-like enzyme
MRRILYIFIVLTLVGAAAFFVSKNISPVRSAKDFNVIVISIDTLRADFIGAYGNSAIETPHLDAIAKDGILFEHFYSTINTTLPSHASLFTGIYPRNHGVARNAMRLSAQNLTMAEFLKERGYSTAAFIGSFALASVFGLNQGFDLYEESFIGDPSRLIGQTTIIHTKDGKKLEALEPDTQTGDITRDATAVKNSFEKWVQTKRNTKFFGFIHFYDPHFPYLPPEKWYKKRLELIPENTPLTEVARINFYPTFKNLVGSIENFRASQVGSVEFSPVIDALMQLYSAEIEYVDSVIGEIVESLNRSGLRDKTILVITSDHGENLIEHAKFNSFFRHGVLTYETETWIPFIISCPGILPEGKRIAARHSQIDFFPTIMELLEFDHNLKLDGKSFYEVLSGKDQKPLSRMLFSEASQPRIREEDSFQGIWPNNENASSVWYGDWKYTRIPWRKYEAVFRLTQDPLEQRNLMQVLIQKDPELVQKLRVELSKWQKHSGDIDTTFELSEEDKEKLESLGYVN